MLAQISMASKTARAFLDCKDFRGADGAITLGLECWQRIERQRAHLPASERLAPALAKSHLTLLVYAAEKARPVGVRRSCRPTHAADGRPWPTTAQEWGLMHVAATHALFERARALLPLLPGDALHVALLAHNFGADRVTCRALADAVVWLRYGRGAVRIGRVPSLGRLTLSQSPSNCAAKASRCTSPLRRPRARRAI